MFIYNIKISGGKALRIIIIALSIFMLIVFGISIYRIFFSSGKFVVNDKIKNEKITEIKAENYTNILQAVHDKPESYLGMKIKFIGYVYRVFDFEQNQFVIARDMYINNTKTQTVVVGFLCNYKDAQKFQDGTWVEITGTIENGKYHNEDIPIVKINEMNECETPNIQFVEPPSNTYVPTNGTF